VLDSKLETSNWKLLKQSNRAEGPQETTMTLRLPRILAAGVLALFVGVSSARADHPLSGHSHGNFSYVPAEPTACNNCCSSGCGQFYAGAEVLYWSRSNSRDVTLLQDEIGNTVFDSDDLDLDYEPGFRLTAGYQWDGCNGIVFIFTDVGNWDTDDTVLSEELFLRLPSDGFFPFPGSEFLLGANVRSWSELHSGELMYTRACGSGITLLAGLRYVHEDENLEIQTLDVFGDSAALRTEAENHIFAFQVGAYGSYCVCDRLSIDGTVKVGAGLNVARMHNTVAFSSLEFGDGVFRDDQDTREKLAFIGEAGLFASYRVSDCLTVRAGYQVLYLSGVALAPEQIDFSADPTVPSDINVNGGILYHGGSLGVMFTW
jgi:hypothetical protein